MYGVSFLALVGVVFTSCEKASLDEINDSQLSYEGPKLRESAMPYQLVALENGDYSCPKEPGNCIAGDDDIVITAEAALDYVFEAASNGNCIATALSDKKSVLVNYIDEDYIDGAVNQSLTVTCHENSSNDLKYIIFEDSTGDEIAYQFSFNE